jgi:hypothetical protein
MQATEGGPGLIDQGLLAGEVADVAGQRHGLAAARPDRGDGGGQIIGCGQVVGYDVESGIRQGKRDGAADAAARARDQGVSELSSIHPSVSRLQFFNCTALSDAVSKSIY